MTRRSSGYKRHNRGKLKLCDTRQLLYHCIRHKLWKRLSFFALSLALALFHTTLFDILYVYICVHSVHVAIADGCGFYQYRGLLGNTAPRALRWRRRRRRPRRLSKEGSNSTSTRESNIVIILSSAFSHMWAHFTPISPDVQL